MVMFNLMIKKEITNCDNGNVQSDQEESKWNSSTHTLLHNKIMKNPIKSKWNSNKDFITRACLIGLMVPI